MKSEKCKKCDQLISNMLMGCQNCYYRSLDRTQAAPDTKVISPAKKVGRPKKAAKAKEAT